MIGRHRYKNRIELLQGTLDMLILQTLQWGPHHGYGIVQALRVSSGEVLQVETGSLYPCPASVGTPGLGTLRVEADGKQPAREVLPNHRRRQKTVSLRSQPLATHGRGHRRSHAPRA